VNRITPRGIVIHHSALGGDADGRADLARIDAIHARRGWGIFYAGRTYHVGYHYVIRRDGTIEPGRPERCRGAHTRGHNDLLGICLLGDFTHRGPTAAQRRSLLRLCRDLMARYRIPPGAVVRHRDLAG
jgi:hypothetical protein